MAKQNNKQKIKEKENKYNRRKLVLWGASIFFGVGLVLCGLFKSFDMISKLEEFKVDKNEISFALPDWISDEGKHDINNLLLLDDKQTILDKNLTVNIAKAYENNPVFKRVVSVTKKFPNKIKVSLSLRKPIAIVKCKGKRFLIDSDNVKLPSKYYNWPNKSDSFVYIAVDKLVDIPLSGKSWQDERIIAGVDLAGFLEKNKAIEILNIKEIDVSRVGKNYGDRKSEVILWTKNNTKIKWGCSSLNEKLDELTDSEKLKNLFSVAKATGKNFSGLEYIDVRWTKPIAKSKG